MSQNVAVVKVDDEDDGFITFEGPEGFRVTVDLYDTHNDFVMLRRKHLNEENPNAYHNAISDYFAKMGFPKPSTRKADKLATMIADRMDELKKKDNPEPLSSTSTTSAGSTDSGAASEPVPPSEIAS